MARYNIYADAVLSNLQISAVGLAVAIAQKILATGAKSLWQLIRTEILPTLAIVCILRAFNTFLMVLLRLDFILI
jgi:hypothetical protein